MRCLILLSILSCVSAIWIPRYEPCQKNNAQCEIGDFQIGDNETTCRTTARDEYGWDRKSCITFLQQCESIEHLNKRVWTRIDCSTITNAATKTECQKWKVTEYCTFDWLNIIAGFIIGSILILAFLYCFLGVGRKSNKELEEEESLEMKKLIKKVGNVEYKHRVKRF